MSLLLSFVILVSFFVLGDSVWGSLLRDRTQNLAERLIQGACLGLALYVLALCNFYFLSRTLTVQNVAWPLFILFLLPALAIRRQPAENKMDILAWSALIVPSLAVLLFSIPLIGKGLSFYYLNNGEFANFAALGDITQYHPATTPIHWWFPLATRETVMGLVCAQVATVLGKPALWVVFPVAWALAWLGLAVQGLLFRQVALQMGAGAPARWMILILYAWAAFSATAQFSWTVSWGSQYLNIPLFYGALLCLVQWQGTAAGLYGRASVLGILLGALLCDYPELFTPNVVLLAAFAAMVTLGAWRRQNQLASLGLGLILAALLGNQFGVHGLLLRLVSSASNGGLGWNIYGSHSDPMSYFGRLLGMTSVYLGPDQPHPGHAALAAAGLAASLLYGAWSLFRPSQPLARGLGALTCAFYGGLALLFVVISRNGTGVNYIIVKWVFQYNGLAYLGAAAALAALRQRWLLVGTALLIAIVSRDMVKTSVRFAAYQRNGAKAMTFTEADGIECRRALGPSAKAYVSALPDMDNYKIIGKFMVYERDLFTQNGTFPSYDLSPYSGHDPVLLLGDPAALSGDKSIRGRFRPFFSRSCLTLLRKTGSP